MGWGPRLRNRIVRAETVSDADAHGLFDLFAAHYEHVTWRRFATDLREKDYVLLLHEAGTGLVRGFSTQKVLRLTVGDVPVRAVFSGDTIIDPVFWGEQELVRGWCRFAGAVRAEAPDIRLFWFLISKGYRTYLYLPVFFKRYYPRHDTPTPPFEQAVMDTLARLKYPGVYRPEAGVLEFAERLGSLVPALAAVPLPRLTDPRVQFFLARNPGYARGDELVCLTELGESNRRSIAARAFQEGERTAGVAALVEPDAPVAATSARVGAS
jgi:hypothetical protein